MERGNASEVTEREEDQMARTPERKRPAAAARLRPEDWAEAALEALSEGGMKAVAVEPLATRLGTTKGSFYWHFADRRALLAAALELWEQQHTEALIAALERQPDPAARLQHLLELVVRYSQQDRVELALLASADDALVGPALRRVTERRIGYVRSLYEELGQPRVDAERSALLAVSTYLGHLQLAHVVPHLLPEDDATWGAHLDVVVQALLPLE
jgi:AcrR family transcriptional regulator